MPSLRAVLPALLLICVTSCGAESGGPSSTMLTVAALDGQVARTAVVNTVITEPLRVEVRRDGKPVAGVQVEWGTSSGSVSPTISLTDATGTASATWTVGVRAGTGSAWGRVEGMGNTAQFVADVIPGPVVAIEKVSGDAQLASRVTSYGLADLVARPVDAYGNALTGPPLVWQVHSGPVEFQGPPATDQLGRSIARIRGTGEVGIARIGVLVEGSSIQAEFHLEFHDGPWQVSIANRGYYAVELVSRQNNTRPAVDTLPVGATMVWVNQDYWDAISPHIIESVGTPAFPTCPDLVEYDSACEFTFFTPGTYRYQIRGLHLPMGIVVVR